MMKKIKYNRIQLLIFSVFALVLASCSSTDDQASADNTFTAQPAETSTSDKASATPSASTTASTPTTKKSASIGRFTFDKDRMQEVSSSNFSFRNAVVFSTRLDGSYVECYKGDGYMTCSGTPDDSIADVENPPFSGRPNNISLSNSELTYNIGEGGPPGAAELETGQWVTMGVADCGRPDNATLVCTSDNAAFQITGKDRTIRTKGNVVPTDNFYEDAAEEAKRNGTDYNQNQDVLVSAPMMCGAATGPRLAEVVEGEITCEEAMSVLDHYESIAQAEGGGNTLATAFDGWACQYPTAMTAQEEHAKIMCENPQRGIKVNAPM